MSQQNPKFIVVFDICKRKLLIEDRENKLYTIGVALVHDRNISVQEHKAILDQIFCSKNFERFPLYDSIPKHLDHLVQLAILLSITTNIL